MLPCGLNHQISSNAIIIISGVIEEDGIESCQEFSGPPLLTRLKSVAVQMTNLVRSSARTAPVVLHILYFICILYVTITILQTTPAVI